MDAYSVQPLSAREFKGHLSEVAALRQAVAGAPDGAPWGPGAWRDLGHALREAGRPDEAMAVVGQACELHPDFTDLYFLEALLHLDRGHAAAMRRSFHACLALGETRRYPSVEGVGSYRAHHNLGLFRELSGDLHAARIHYEAALEAPIFRFYQAAALHRIYVLRDLLPKYDLIVD